MAYTDIPVQLTSFRGIYSMEGDPPVFTPKELTMTHPDDVNGNDFTNTRGKCLLVINNNDVTNLTLTLDATVEVSENPGEIPVQDPQVVVDAGDSNVIGPFSGNFEVGTTGKVGMTWAGITDVNDVDIAIIKLP